MRRTLLPLAAALAAASSAGLAACGGDDETTQTTTAAACRSMAAPEPKLTNVPKPTGTLSSTVAWRAIVETNCGTFTITLDAEHSPRTTASFVALARAGFYDGLTFHRIAPGFVIQGGDPTGAGYGGPGWTIVERPPRDVTYLRGVVAMAKTATERDGTSGSQFFVVTGEDAKLPPQYAVLGHVSEGFGVVAEIERSRLRSTDPQGSAPVSPVVIERIQIRQG